MGIHRWLAVGSMCLLAVVGMAACGGGEATTTEVPESPAGKADVVNFHGVHSGELELVLEIDRTAKRSEAVNMRIVGPFLKAGEEELPQLDLAVESSGDLAGRHVEFLSGPLLRAEKWVVNFDGEVYEPGQRTFKELKSKFEEAQEEEGAAGNAMACVEAAEGFKLTDVLQQVSYEGPGEALDGVKLETVGADLDVPAAFDELIALGEGSPGCKAQLEAIGLPPAAQLEELERELRRSLAEARLTLSLDKNGVVREFRLVAELELPHQEELNVELTMRLSHVNEVTQLPITHGYTPYPALLRQFGLDDEDVKQADAGEIWLGILGVLSARMSGREDG